ncbi:DUF4124 domain-containing protein [Pseudomonas sp. CAU 1711]|uniref:DUF4124 domain-containing protein n=1 Tax=Pseudomonas sp. CAU 1711 TaxID=3140356 RepID=UPI0032619CB5
MRTHHLLTLLLLCSATSLQAQVYTWVDANGQKHFGSQPPTPEQQVETVDIRQGYSSDGQQPAVVETTPDATSESATAEASAAKAPSSKAMCSEAMRWTAIDIPNLKEIAGERKKAGKITADQHKQALKGLDEAKKHLTMQNCLASTGRDRERFECLSRGAGIMVCSGALEAALKNL